MGAAERPQPLGIGNCPDCAYLQTGPSTVCYLCARQDMQDVAAGACQVCDQDVADGSRCRNILCGWPLDQRGFEWNFAIAMRTGILQRAISRYKYDGRSGWGTIFARVLTGCLDEHTGPFREFDLIVASPTFLDGTRAYDHTRAVIDRANEEAQGRWPFDVSDPRAIVKTRATPRFARLGWADRRQAAENELRSALDVPAPHRITGKRILVYDDVFTDGLTLREVALCLRGHGATRVCGITLSRQPWQETGEQTSEALS